LAKIKCERTKFDTEQKSSKFLLEITALLSSANNTGSETEFILRGKSFIYITNNGGPEIDPWLTPFFKVPQSQKKILVVLGDFTSNFFLLLDKEDLKQLSDTPQIPHKCKLACSTIKLFII